MEPEQRFRLPQGPERAEISIDGLESIGAGATYDVYSEDFVCSILVRWLIVDLKSDIIG